MKIPYPLILASASPARAELLRDAGYTFDQIPSDAEEPPREVEETTNEYVLRLADVKSQVLQRKFPDACILSCDTVIQLDEATLGKPTDSEHAYHMIQRMSGRSHTVHTGMMLRAPNEKVWTGVDVTTVTFKPLSHEEVDSYIKLSNPTRFAGAYAIQKEGAGLIQKTEGRLDTVIGLSINKVKEGLVTLFTA